MKKVTLFVIRNCPYCRKALREMEILFEQHPDYRNVELEIVDEDEQSARAKTFDYYYVPTFYVGAEKVHEGVVRGGDIPAVFQRAME